MFPLSCAGARPCSNWNAPAQVELLPHSWNWLAAPPFYRYEPPIEMIEDLASRNVIWAGNHVSWTWSIEEDDNPDLQTITRNFRCLTNEQMNEIGQRSGDLAFGIERLQGGKVGEFQHIGMLSNILCSHNDAFQVFRVLGAFAFSRNASSVSPHLSARIPLNGFPRNLVLESFLKICYETPNMVKIWQTHRALYMKISMSFVVTGAIISWKVWQIMTAEEV
jgi:hypothetical protein